MQNVLKILPIILPTCPSPPGICPVSAVESWSGSDRGALQAYHYQHIVCAPIVRLSQPQKILCSNVAEYFPYFNLLTRSTKNPQAKSVIKQQQEVTVEQNGAGIWHISISTSSAQPLFARLKIFQAFFKLDLYIIAYMLLTLATISHPLPIDFSTLENYMMQLYISHISTFSRTRCTQNPQILSIRDDVLLGKIEANCSGAR